MSIMVSVIVPVYNTESYLERCLDSIIKQTYKMLDIILIDDGSTDRSSNICDIYAEKDVRVRVFHKSNKGLSDARNVGIELAKAPFICFVDSDDILHEKYVERLFELCDKYNADIAQCDFLCIDNESRLLPLNTDCEIQELTGREALSEYCNGKNEVQYCVSWNKLYNRKLFNEIRFPVGKQHEDVFTSYKLFALANKVILTTEYMYYYRQRSDSITGMGFTLKSLDLGEALNERVEFLDAHGLYNEAFQVKRRLMSVYKRDIKALQGLGDQKELTEHIQNKYMQLQKSISGISDEDNSVRKEFIFKDYDIIKEKNWALYGAGGYGRYVYNIYKDLNVDTLKLWIDNFWHGKTDIDYTVKPLDRIIENRDLYVVVAIQDEKIKKRVISDLIAWGVQPNKVV